MTPRVLIRLQDAHFPGMPPVLLGTLIEAPPMAGPLTDLAQPVAVDAAALDGAPPEHVGAQVLGALRGHADLAGVLGGLIALPAGQRVAIGFEILSARSSALPWEALFDPAARFLALDDRWPVYRTTKRAGHTPAPALRLPLRACAVLSAVGRTAVPEWEALQGAVALGQGLGAPVDLTVFTGEAAVVAAVEQARAAGNASVQVVPLPDSADGLSAALEAERPQLLHVFGHGDVAAGVPRVHLGTAADHLAGNAPGSVALGLPQLRPLIQRGLWLASLSVCESATPGDESRGLAHDLVAEGLPVALGMRRAVDADVARACCAGFYTAVLRLIAEVAARGPGTHDVEWPAALRPARQRIVEREPGADPAASDAWTIPVLFARPEGFQVGVGAGDGAATNAALGEERVTRAFEALMADAEAPPSLLDDVAAPGGGP